MIHDERGEDAKRYDRRMEAKYGDSGRRGGHGERHDKHAGERQGKPFRKHAKIRKAPFRSADVRQRSSKKPFIPAIARNERLFLYGISQYQPLTG